MNPHRGITKVIMVSEVDRSWVFLLLSSPISSYFFLLILLQSFVGYEIYYLNSTSTFQKDQNLL